MMKCLGVVLREPYIEKQEIRRVTPFCTIMSSQWSCGSVLCPQYPLLSCLFLLIAPDLFCFF